MKSKNKNIVILHSNIQENADADELDTLVEVESVSKVLSSLNYKPLKLTFDNNQNYTAGQLKNIKPLCVFNLVETVHGDGRLAHFAPALLEHLDIPFTGCDSTALFLTSTKLLCKKMMKAHDIPTPLWFTKNNSSGRFKKGNYIVKPVWEDASVGIDSDSVRYCQSITELLAFLDEREQLFRKECFAELFIDGREFNISIISDKNKKISVLPPAEIIFGNFGKRLKIIDYKAKWDEDSFEYKNTNRSFKFGKQDAHLLAEIKKLSIRCANLFSLSGYCRIDMRIDKNNNPHILEINANPCISPDSGFSAAAARAGLTYSELIKRIIQTAI